MAGKRTRKPTVLFINRVYQPDRGASGRMLRDLAQAFVRQGWGVSVLTTGKQRRQDQDGNVRVTRVGVHLRRKNVFAYGEAWLRLLIAGLRLPRHDLVVSMTDPPMLVVAGAIIARRKSCRHIHWCQDVYPELMPVLGYKMPERLEGLLARMSRRAMKSCDRVIVIGRCMARSLIHRGLDARSLSVIPNWPDRELMEGYTPKPAEIVTTPARIMPAGKPPDMQFRDTNDMKFRVLYAGSLGRAHPIETVLGAALILQRSHPDVEFVFVGNGPQFERLATERARRGLDNIKLLPWQPTSALRPLMESGDVHLVTMRHDAAGLLVPCKLYSALAVGRPCILVGPEHSEAARVLLDFNAGVVIPQGEAVELAAAICRFREDGDFWFNAQQGASKAGTLFIPSESLKAWTDRAWSIVSGVQREPVKVVPPTESGLPEQADKAA